MGGRQRECPCPMCIALLGPPNGNARDLDQRISLAVVAHLPIERLTAFRRARLAGLRLYTGPTGDYSRDYFGLMPGGSEIPSPNVFSRRDGPSAHSWSGEMTGDSADPGQDPRGAPGPAAPVDHA